MKNIFFKSSFQELTVLSHINIPASHALQNQIPSKHDKVGCKIFLGIEGVKNLLKTSSEEKQSHCDSDEHCSPWASCFTSQ